MVTKFLFRLFVLLISIALYLNLPSSVAAEQLNWTKTYSSSGDPTTIKIAPSDHSIVYASLRLTGGFDILKSTDGGQTWASIKNNLSDGLDVNWISVYKTNPNILAISLWNSGAYISENGGQNWTKMSSFLYTRSIEINPSDINTIYLGVGGNHGGDSGLYKSVDKGVTWTKFSNLRSDNNAQILIDNAAPETVYADIDPDFFRSYDGGNSWTQLPLYRAYANSILDNRDPNTVYTPSFDIDPGIYKSLDQGNTWNKNISFVGNPFRLTQNETGVIFSSVASGDAGVWQNTDGSASWQDVGDVAWGSSPTWGIDAKEGKIIVGVSGLGIFFANTNPPPPAPNPVVFIPGFGASWSYNGLVLNWQTTYKDWSLFPKFTDGYYGPLLTSLQSAGLKTDQNLFTFAYDYRKSITDNAVSLNSFLTNEVATRNAGLKANVVAHSMGGLIARQCFEKTIGCGDKINKIVTAGTPHQGLTESYNFWEGGKVVEKDLLRRFSENLIVHLISTPFGSVKDLVQANFPGVRDLLPVFDYIDGNPYLSMSDLGHNPNLEALNPVSPNFIAALTALSGNTTDTQSSFTTKSRNPHEILFNVWADGKPQKSSFLFGDDTVMQTSSEVAGAINKYYPVAHSDYLSNSTVINDVLNTFGLTAAIPAAPAQTLQSLAIVYTQSPNVEFSSADPNAFSTEKGKIILGSNLNKKKMVLKAKSLKPGDFQVNFLYVDKVSNPVFKSFSGKIKSGETETLDTDNFRAPTELN